MIRCFLFSRLSSLSGTRSTIMAPPQHPFSRPLTRARARDVHATPPMMSPPSSTASSASRMSTASSIDTPALGKRVHTIRQDSLMTPCRSISSSSLSTTDSFSPNPHTGSLKRASRYGVIATEQRKSAVSPTPSSDEEEKTRTQGAKKPRGIITSPRALTRTKVKEKDENSGSDTASPSPPRSPTRVSTSKLSRRGSLASPTTIKTLKPARINLQRNPSILGEPLPLPTRSATILSKTQQAERARFARRMSFSTLTHANEIETVKSPISDDNAGLGSAFQLA